MLKENGTLHIADWGKPANLLMKLTSTAVITYAFAPNLHSYLLPIGWLESRKIQYVGVGLLLVSLGWTMLAQIQMGNSWRIGVEEEKETVLGNSLQYKKHYLILKLQQVIQNNLVLFFHCYRIIFMTNQISVNLNFWVQQKEDGQ